MTEALRLELGGERLATLTTALGIRDEDRIAESYSDLLGL